MRTVRVGPAALSVAIGLIAAMPSAAQVVFDPHLDLPNTAAAPRWTGLSDPSSQFDLDKAKRGGLTAAAVALFVPQGRRDPTSIAEARRTLVTRDAAIHAIAERNPDRAGLARSPADVRAIVASGRFAVVESMLNAWPLGTDLSDFDHWYARGIRIVGFVHAGHNQFADSSRPSAALGDPAQEHGGLSTLGKAAVARLNDLGILIDVSQLSDAAFYQVLDASRTPVIASHSDVRGLVDVPRNLSDAQLYTLAGHGGVVAINAFSTYLKPRSASTNAALETLRRDFGVATPGVALDTQRQADFDRQAGAIAAFDRANVADLVNAVDYAVRRIGISHVALSSDFNHGGGITGWDDVSETANVTAELKRRGYTDDQIGMLWGGNVLRVWQQAIDARSIIGTSDGSWLTAIRVGLSTWCRRWIFRVMRC